MVRGFVVPRSALRWRNMPGGVLVSTMEGGEDAMYVTETPFGFMVVDASDPQAQWVDLDELEQPE